MGEVRDAKSHLLFGYALHAAPRRVRRPHALTLPAAAAGGGGTGRVCLHLRRRHSEVMPVRRHGRDVCEGRQGPARPKQVRSERRQPVEAGASGGVGVPGCEGLQG